VAQHPDSVLREAKFANEWQEPPSITACRQKIQSETSRSITAHYCDRIQGRDDPVQAVWRPPGVRRIAWQDMPKSYAERVKESRARQAIIEQEVKKYGYRRDSMS
jgi:hypothetical protein